MTPTQLRAFAAVVRLGSVKDAAAELKVSESAVSLNVGQLRKELGDKLFTRTAAGLAFTPGGLRLASRSAELLGLQDRTIIEVGEAARGKRLGWKPSGGKAKKQDNQRRFWACFLIWSLGSALAWTGLAFWRMITMNPDNVAVVFGLGLFELLLAVRVLVPPAAGGAR